MKDYPEGTTHYTRGRTGILLAGALLSGMLMTQPAYAVLNAASCEQLAETAVGVYELAIRNGATHAGAKGYAESTFKRRVAEEGGPKPSTMPDDIDDCVRAGLGRAKLLRIIAPFYP